MSALDIAIPAPRSRFLLWKWRFWRQSKFSPFAWQFWYEERWQKNAWWSLGSWMTMTILFVVVVSRWGHGLRYLIVSTIATDVVNYIVNKKEIFPDRKVSHRNCGWKYFIAAAFWFALHKGLMLLMALVLGVGVFWIRGIQGFLGILENPVAYKYNTLLAFAEQEEFEVTTDYWRLEMCHAAAASRQILMRIGIM